MHNIIFNKIKEYQTKQMKNKKKIKLFLNLYFLIFQKNKCVFICNLIIMENKST